MLTALALIGSSAIIVAQRRLIANLRSLAATQERSITVRDGMLSTQAEALSLLEDSNLWWEIAARGWQDRAEELGHE